MGDFPLEGVMGERRPEGLAISPMIKIEPPQPPVYRLKMGTIISTAALLCGLNILTYDILYVHHRNRFKHLNEVANRITCSLFQLYLICETSGNLYHHIVAGTTDALPAPETRDAELVLTGYFVYDSLMLLSTPRGRRQTLFLVHHIVSLSVLALNKLYNPGSNGLNNSLILILEAASPLLNLVKIAEEAAPAARITRTLQFLTKVAYIASRQGALLGWLVMASQKANATWVHQTIFGAICLVYLLSVKWTATMLQKPQRD